MQGVLIPDTSDHYPVFSINWQIKEKCVNIVSWCRNMNARNVNRFKQLIAECEWHDSFTHLDTNTAFERFHEKWKSAYDTAFPKSQIRKCYRTKKPWLTEALKTSIKTKKLNCTFNIKKCNSVYNECKYKDYRNKLNKMIKATEKNYYQEKLEMNKTDMRKTWTIIKEVIGKNKATQVQTKFKLSSVEIKSDKRTICEKFNSFFVNIGPTLSKSFEGHRGSPDKYLRDRQINSLLLTLVSSHEIRNILNWLNDSAPGYGEIRLGPLKLIMPYIEGTISYICNLPLNQGIFPNILKIANVIPLYKKEDPLIFSNYRPVSLLCSLSKVLEIIIYNRVI